MLAWSLSGPIALALAAFPSGDRGATVARAHTPLRIVALPAHPDYRMPTARRVDHPALSPALTRSAYLDAASDRRFDRAAVGRRPVTTPQEDSVQALLRDRKRRNGGALDARVEWHLTGAGSDVGLGGGLKRVVDTLLHD